MPARDYVEIEAPKAEYVEIETPRSSYVIVEVGDQVQGEPGPPGFSGVQFALSPAASSFTLNNPTELTRWPSVTIFNTLGELVHADVFVSENVTTIVFPAPFTGLAILN